MKLEAGKVFSIEKENQPAKLRRYYGEVFDGTRPGDNKFKEYTI